MLALGDKSGQLLFIQCTLLYTLILFELLQWACKRKTRWKEPGVLNNNVRGEATYQSGIGSLDCYPPY